MKTVRLSRRVRIRELEVGGNWVLERHDTVTDLWNDVGKVTTASLKMLCRCLESSSENCDGGNSLNDTTEV